MAQTTLIYTSKESTEESIDRISDFIHDWYFDLADVSFDKARSELTIAFDREFFDSRDKNAEGILGRVEIPVYRSYLTIGNVEGYETIDTLQIGRYDFESLSFEADSKVITIHTNTPLGFEIRVDAFQVTLSRDELPFSHRKSWPFGI